MQFDELRRLWVSIIYWPRTIRTVFSSPAAVYIIRVYNCYIHAPDSVTPKYATHLFFSFLSKRDPRAKGIPPRPKPIVTHTHTHTSDHNILLYCSISIYGSTRTWYPYNIYMISIYTHIYILYRVPLIHSTP